MASRATTTSSPRPETTIWPAAKAPTVRLRLGTGHDTIKDDDTTAGVTDRVVFLTVNSGDVSVERVFKGSDSIRFSFTTTSADSLTVIGALSDDDAGIETYQFADGVIWTKASIEARLDNNAPVAVKDGYFTAVTGEPLTISKALLLRNDFDADGDEVSIVAVNGGADGVAILNAQGDIVYTPTAGFPGPTQFTYTLSDGRNGVAQTTVDIRVRPVASAQDDFGFVVAEDGLPHHPGRAPAVERYRRRSHDRRPVRSAPSMARSACRATATSASHPMLISPGSRRSPISPIRPKEAPARRTSTSW